MRGLIMRHWAVLGTVCVMAACACGESPKAQSKPTCLEGKVVYKGNAPFAQLHLQTKAIAYRLDFSAAKSTDLEQALSKRQNDTLVLCGKVVSDQVPNSLILLVSPDQPKP
jgi:hypothetical protein